MLVYVELGYFFAFFESVEGESYYFFAVVVDVAEDEGVPAWYCCFEVDYTVFFSASFKDYLVFGVHDEHVDCLSTGLGVVGAVDLCGYRVVDIFEKRGCTTAFNIKSRNILQIKTMHSLLPQLIHFLRPSS